jgi:hypothetical protein
MSGWLTVQGRMVISIFPFLAPAAQHACDIVTVL